MANPFDPEARIMDMPMSWRVRRLLMAEGMRTAGQVASMSDRALLSLSLLGIGTLAEVRALIPYRPKK